MLTSTVRAAALAGAVLMASTPGLAQPPAAVPTAPSARSIELVKRMMVASGVEKMVDTMIGAMLPAMSRAKEFQDLPPEGREVILSTLREVMRDTFTPRLIEEVTPAYAAAFTEAELEAIVQFYEGPVGRKVIEQTPALTEKSTAAARKLIPEFQAEVMRRVCERMDCGGEKPPGVVAAYFFALNAFTAPSVWFTCSVGFISECTCRIWPWGEITNEVRLEMPAGRVASYSLATLAPGSAATGNLPEHLSVSAETRCSWSSLPAVTPMTVAPFAWNCGIASANIFASMLQPGVSAAGKK